jgi:hypothetical protein
MSEENILLTPEEVENRRKNKRERIKKEVKEEISEKFYNRGGQVAINYETLGRFSIPSTLYFKDFTAKHENDLELTRREDQLETTIAILNELKNEDANCKIEDMLLEEFFETLIGIKKQFDSSKHVHLWVCDCQSDEDKPQVNDTVIDLNTITYQSISKADNELKDFYKKKFELMDNAQFQEYLFIRHKDNPSIELENRTKEEELETIKVKEPFMISLDHKYLFRFPRIGDLVKAKKIADKRFAPKIKDAQNKKNPNSVLPVLQEQKKIEIDKLEEEKFRYTALATRALSLISVDEKELTDEERINLYSELPRNIKNKIKDFLEQFEFGIQHEYEFVCPLPGCGRKDRRLLQRELTVFELLPSYTITKNEFGQNPEIDIYVGA